MITKAVKPRGHKLNLRNRLSISHMKGGNISHIGNIETLKKELSGMTIKTKPKKRIVF